jgi:hypothetical protein
MGLVSVGLVSVGPVSWPYVCGWEGFCCGMSVVDRRTVTAITWVEFVCFCTIGCPTNYQTWQFFNHFTSNDYVAQLAALHTHSSSFLTYERTAVQISLHYVYLFGNY